MKKVLALFLTVFALCVNAKTIEELVVELDNAKATSNRFIAYIFDDVYFANKADVAKMYDTWKNTNVARYEMNETADLVAEGKVRSTEQRKQDSVRNGLCARHIINNNLYVDAGRAAIVQATTRTARYFKGVKPSWYDGLKANDFVVDGYKFSDRIILKIAVEFDDVDLVMSLPSAVFGEPEINYFCKKAVQVPDLNNAKAKCKELISNAIIQEKTDTAYFTKLQALNKHLTTMIIDAKIIK